MRIAIALCILLLASPLYAVVNEDFARIKQVSNDVCAHANTIEEKVMALSHYVHAKLKPDASKGIPATAQLSTMDRLDSGVGWCNHQAGVFMRLAEAQGIKTRMLYLLNDEGTASHHTIAEAFVGGRWVIIDPMFDLEIYNAKGELVSCEDVLLHPKLLRSAPLVDKRRSEIYNGDEKQFSAWIRLYTNRPIIAFELGGGIGE